MGKMHKMCPKIAKEKLMKFSILLTDITEKRSNNISRENRLLYRVITFNKSELFDFGTNFLEFFLELFDP